MPVIIKRIEIINFRSIQKMTIDCTRLQLLVGYNDAGKSNILRALNLFFNGETNADEAFNFKTDYNIYADKITTTRKKAKEIKIKITLEIPESYRKTNGDHIEWTKTWRSHEFYEEIIGIGYANGPRGGVRQIRKEIPARSNLKTLLSNIQFIYVPAIKDKHYIAKLRSEIYQVVNEAFTDKFSKSSKDFEVSIAENLNELTDDITSHLGFKSTLSLPKDLSSLFERLDFLNENSISLNERGDGVKARHIPLILKFIADKRKGLQAQGNPPYTFIWAYEEPENNLEITNSIKLADQLSNLIENPISQILLTTHSPAFYNLAKQSPDEVGCYFIDKDSNDSTICDSNLEVLDSKMGMLELLTPHIERIKKELHDIETVSTLGIEKPIIYVEGPTDEKLLKKAIAVFHPEHAGKIEIITKDYGGGTNYVFDMLTAYFHMHKHHQDRHKAIGFVDADSDGRECKDKISKLIRTSKANTSPPIKCLLMKVSKDVLEARKAGFNLPGILEDNYPISIWQDEFDKGKLKERDLSSVLSRELYNKTANTETTISQLLEGKSYSLKVKYNIDPFRKIKVADKVLGLPPEKGEDCYEFLKPTITEIIDFFKFV
jgi:predicted ATP-dependent endonuclease of OLD family